MGNSVSPRISSVGVISAAVDKGQPKDGVQNGPKELNNGGLKNVLNTLDARITDYGEISQSEEREPDVILNCRNQRALVQTTTELTKLVAKAVSENDMTLILGGDHSIGIGSIAGQCKAFPSTFVVWVDAHTDINTPSTSCSKNTHGMPVAFLIKEIRKQIPNLMGFENIKAVLDPNQVVYIGIRDVDTPELQLLKEFNIPYFSMQDVHTLGIEKVMELTLKHAFKYDRNCHIHLSFDIDSLDPKHAPSTGTPVPDGLSLNEGKYICRSISQTGKLKSMVLAEVNTSLGSAEDAKTTVNSAIEVIKSALQLDRKTDTDYGGKIY